MSHPEHTVLIATAFYHAQGKSPNAWTLSDSAKFSMYYRCMVVCYASLRRAHPATSLVLFTNRELPEPFRSQLVSLQVQTLNCPDRYVSDPAVENNFPGCLYTLDVLDYLTTTTELKFDTLLLIDNDCVLRGRLDPLFELVRHTQAVFAYSSGYPVNNTANGHSRASLTLALAYLEGDAPRAPLPLYGGEFLAAPAAALPALVAEQRRFWNWMKHTGIGLFGRTMTEEHVLSVALALYPDVVDDAAPYVKRIWTTDHFCTVTGEEPGIALWHLPSEKKRGLARLYQLWCKRGGFEGWDDTRFATEVDRCIPLQSSTGPRWLRQRLRTAAKVLVTGRS